MVSAIAGGVVGTATNLYADELRELLERVGAETLPAAVAVLTPAVVGSGVSMMVLWLLVRQRRQTRVQARVLRIGVDALKVVKSIEDRIVNKVLHYLEARRSSDTLVIFLPGLGLDAEDFRPYMATSRLHCVALTLFGFNASEERNEAYQPISLDSHVQLTAWAIDKIHRRYPRKKLVLVGFSFGADLLLFLAQSHGPSLRSLKPTMVVLLDPNVNHTTTTISSRISAVGSTWDVRELVQLLDSARGIPEFRYLCEYLRKITTKNSDRVREHARDVVERWGEAESIGPFLERLRSVVESAGRVRVCLSSSHDALYNRIVRGSGQVNIDAERDLLCPPVEHFELIEPEFLERVMEDVR